MKIMGTLDIETKYVQLVCGTNVLLPTTTSEHICELHELPFIR